MRSFLSVHKLPELMNLESLIDDLGDLAQVQVLDTIKWQEESFPLYCVSLGVRDPKAPVVGFVGGVHGLERIGTQVLNAYLRTTQQLLKWDDSFRARLENSRIVFFPLVNPVGMLTSQRSNGNGVDLMRNAPVDADEAAGFLYGGHRISPKIPWFRGELGQPMERESQALCAMVRKEIFPSSCAITLDVHSGFGTIDRIWFPYARTRLPFYHFPETFALKQLLDATYPHHFYKMEPQARQYLTNGDIWDFLYDEHRAQYPDKFFVPMTLEIGSWLWIRKNPRQIFSLLGAFHPIQPHRHQRILRRHNTLFEFLHRSVVSSKHWIPQSEESRETLRARALQVWYDET